MYDPKMDVLVVDDALAMRGMIKRLLREIGLTNLREAENGSHALDELKKKKADLVLSDWNMPVMSGIDLLRAIRADADLRLTRVLMVTAEGRKENLMEALQAGVDNFIVKPFTAKILEEKLNKIFGVR
jgi:two-component system chemotaxis response regulator CheY